MIVSSLFYILPTEYSTEQLMCGKLHLVSIVASHIYTTPVSTRLSSNAITSLHGPKRSKTINSRGRLDTTTCNTLNMLSNQSLSSPSLHPRPLPLRSSQPRLPLVSPFPRSMSLALGSSALGRSSLDSSPSASSLLHILSNHFKGVHICISSSS